MRHDDRTGFFFWGMVHGSESVDPLRRIGEETDQASVLSGLGHCQTELAGDGILTMIIESTKGTFMPPVLAEGTWLKPTTFDSGEPCLGLILSNRRVREDVFSPLSFFTMRPIAPFSPRPAASPSSSTSSGSVGSVHRERSRSPRTPLPPMAPASVPGSTYPVPRTPMCDARRYCSLFPRRRVAPPNVTKSYVTIRQVNRIK
ncbi:hypothetical protein PIB30_042040 [Stylosanthes scabra]|uniref:Uncharacterized protein n=1 Tax=Stylosanthes scabra TaxID=79078 RepID=A0ABU6WD67_9FABA|nr:hypothetical protein [Stylosanthes scabra]